MSNMYLFSMFNCNMILSLLLQNQVCYPYRLITTSVYIIVPINHFNIFSFKAMQQQWPATAQLAQLTANTRSPPPQDPDTPLNLSKQRSPSPAQPMMLPRFVPYPPMEESQYSMPKEEEYNAACNSKYL